MQRKTNPYGLDDEHSATLIAARSIGFFQMPASVFPGNMNVRSI